MSEIVLKPVGFVRNSITEGAHPAGRPPAEEDSPEKHALWRERIRQSREARKSISELVIDESLAELLDGVEEFSHLLVLYWANRIPEERRTTLKVHPMGRKDLPLMGIFATRSPVRPNPVLATRVRLLERQGNILKVQGLEAIDGSPIMDIKPQVHDQYEDDERRMPDWMREIHQALDEEETDE
ncbi:MAG: tRNA (N6-threonylcarbamoyladenosine(37)-N6)-methyltransferase TrmO [Dehalococcoidia bacterium]